MLNITLLPNEFAVICTLENLCFTFPFMKIINRLEERNRTHEDWTQLLFSDEFTFSIRSDNRLNLIGCERKIRNKPQFFRKRTYYEGDSLMV